MERTMEKDPGEDQSSTCLLICIGSTSITIISSREIKIALIKHNSAI